MWREVSITGEIGDTIEFYSSAIHSTTREATTGNLLLATVTFSANTPGTHTAIRSLIAKSMTSWDAVDFVRNESSQIVGISGMGLNAEIVVNEDENIG